MKNYCQNDKLVVYLLVVGLFKCVIILYTLSSKKIRCRPTKIGYSSDLHFVDKYGFTVVKCRMDMIMNAVARVLLLEWVYRLYVYCIDTRGTACRFVLIWLKKMNIIILWYVQQHLNNNYISYIK